MSLQQVNRSERICGQAGLVQTLRRFIAVVGINPSLVSSREQSFRQWDCEGSLSAATHVSCRLRYTRPAINVGAWQ